MKKAQFQFSCAISHIIPQVFFFPPVARDILMVQSCNISHTNEKKWTKWLRFLCINLNCWRVILLVQAQTLSGRIFKVVASYICLKVARSTPGTCCTDLYCARLAQVVLPMRVGLNATQFNLPFLTPFSVAGCGRLQLGVTPWATSVALLKVVDI